MTPGQVLFDPAFTFDDGNTGAKLFVTLNDGLDNSYLTVLTTSQRHTKAGTAGCHVAQFPSNFHFPGGTAFPKDTWLILNNIYEFESYALTQKIKAGHISIKAPLPITDLIDVLNCIINDEDLSDQHCLRLTAFRDALQLAHLPAA